MDFYKWIVLLRRTGYLSPETLIEDTENWISTLEMMLWPG